MTVEPADNIHLMDDVYAVLSKLMPKAAWDTDEMQRTPERWSKMMVELTNPDDADFEFTTFPNEFEVDEMVIVKDIPFVTLCAHHLIPFIGKCHIAYVPGSKLAGLSKFKRLVNYWSKGCWNQESLTQSIALALEEHLQDAQGVAVVMTAEHLCMTIRGAQSVGTTTTTSCMRGCFRDKTEKARQEFLYLLRTP
jgi:GTP cyclohydrolase I